MSKRIWPQTLRGRLVAAILLVAVGVLVGSFVVLHERTGDDILESLDDRLRTDLAEFEESRAGSSDTSQQLARRGRRFIEAQGYHPDSRIFAIEAAGRTFTNQRDLIDEETDEGADEIAAEGDDAGEATSPRGLLAAAPGLSTIEIADGGSLRVLSEPVVASGSTIGTFRVAESLGQVGFAQGSLRDTLLVVGAVALAVLVAAALWIAGLVSRPLRRIASFAAEIRGDDLERRIDSSEGPEEVRSLADSFNRMLDRLQRTFEREREFVVNASHELRTPVTIAQGELDLLRRDAEPAERDRIDLVRRELRTMERLVGELLTLASEEAGSGSRPVPVPIEDLLSDVRRDAPLLGPRRYEVSGAGGTVLADPDQLAQVFRNLLKNAVAHTDEGGDIRVQAIAAGDRVRFEISDDGAGISAEDANNLFDRFSRTESGRRRNESGSGLGLAIARAIVEAHGGTLRAESDGSGRGARFVIALPARGSRP